MAHRNTPAGAMRAIRTTLRDNLDAQLVAKNTQLDDAGELYRLPVSIPDVNIRIRQTRHKTVPQNLPQVWISYENRTIEEEASFGVGNAQNQILITFWYTQAAPTTDGDLDAEEVLVQSSLDMQDAILKALRRTDNVVEGIYGKSSGAVRNIAEEENPLRAAYVDKNSNTYTIEGRSRLRAPQTAEY